MSIAVTQSNRTECTKEKLRALFLSHAEWIQLITDEQIQTRQAEAKGLQSH